MAQGGRSLEFRAGLVVLAGLIILALGLFVVSGGFDRFKDKATYTVLFKDGGGIASGDTVRLAGRKIGSVKAVEESDQVHDGVRYAVAVHVEVFAESKIPVDSTFLVSQTITGIRSFEIKKGDSADAATADSVLTGRKLETFEELIDRTASLVQLAYKTVDDIDRSVLKVEKNIIDKIDVESIQGKIHSVLDTVGGTVEKLEGKIDGWSDKIETLLTDASEAAREGRGLIQDVRRDWPGMRDRANTLLDTGTTTLQTYDNIGKDNRETVKELLQNLNDASRQVGPAVTKLDELLAEVKDTVTQVRPDLAGTLKSARRAMNNFVGATEDLKTAPWKLIKGVSKSESNQVHLYNGARLYVDAASEIRILVDDLDTLRRLGLLNDPSQAATVERLQSELEDALKKFNEAEDKLNTVLEKGVTEK